MTKPNVDDTGLPPEAPPGSDPKPTPRRPRGATSGTLAGNVEVTPLDEDENAKDGIEVKET